MRRRFVVASLLDALGSGVWAPFALLYLEHVRGMEPTDAGLALSIGAVAGLVMGPLLGMAVDRFGALSVLVLANVMGACAFVGYPHVTAMESLVPIAALATAGERSFWVANAPFILSITRGRDADALIAWQSAARFTGFGIGSLVLTLVPLAAGASVAYANAASFVVAGGLLLSISADAPRASTERTRVVGRWSEVASTRGYLPLCGVNLLLAFASASKFFMVPLVVEDVLGTPLWVASATIAIGTVVVATMQVPIARLASRWSRRDGLLVAAGLYVVAYGMLATLELVPLRAAIVILLGCGAVLAVAEALFSPIAHAAAAAAAPAHAQGRASAIYQLSWGLAVAAAPAVLTALLAVGNAVLWSTVACVALLAMPGVWHVSRRLPHALLTSA